jgi:hypothetical protein
MYAFLDSTIAASGEISISCLRPVGLVVQAATRLTARTTNRILFIVGSTPDVIYATSLLTAYLTEDFTAVPVLLSPATANLL